MEVLCGSELGAGCNWLSYSTLLHEVAPGETYQTCCQLTQFQRPRELSTSSLLVTKYGNLQSRWDHWLTFKLLLFVNEALSQLSCSASSSGPWSSTKGTQVSSSVTLPCTHAHTHKCWNAVDPSASCETSMSLLCCLPATTSTSTSSSTTPSPTPPVISDIRYRKVPVATTKVPLPGIWWPPGMPCSSRLEARGLARGMIKDHPNTFLNLKEGPAKNKTDTSWVSLLEDVFWFSMIMAWLERLDKNP